MTKTIEKFDVSAFAMADKAFSSKLTGLKTSDKNMVAGIQALLMAGLMQSIDKNTNAFAALMSHEWGTVRRPALKAWIEAHTNVRITTAKDAAGKLVFKAKLLPMGHADRVELTHDKIMSASRAMWNAKTVADDNKAMLINDETFIKRAAIFNKFLTEGTVENLSDANKADMAEMERLLARITARKTVKA